MSWLSWIGLWGSDDFIAGFDAQAKPSTRYLARGSAIANCADDISQYDLDLATAAGVAYEASSGRFNHSHPRTILVRGTVDNNDTGTLYRHGTGANTERLAFSAANTIEVTVANAVVLTFIWLGLSASAEGFVVAWTSIANPDTTGAGDAVLSTLHVWNTTDGTYDKRTFTHVVKPPQTTTASWGADSSAGTAAFTGTITALLFENREMPGTEIAADWVAALVAPTSDAVTEREELPPQADSVDSQNYHHGPSAMIAADATRRMIRRTVQALRNDRFRVTPSWTAAQIEGSDPFLRGAPGSSDDRMHLSWLAVAPVPDNVNRLWVRVHIRSWTTSGAAVPLRVRLYSMSKPPGSFGVGGPGGGEPLTHFHVQATITRDDDASVGQYTVLGSMPIARGLSGVHEGMTYLGLALQVDPSSSSANDANARVAVNAIHVVPYFRADALPLPVAT
jgi:hypothetical protein